MFYNHNIEIYQQQNTTNDYGEEVTGGMFLIATAKADLQPFSNERLKQAYGLEEKVNYMIYCEPIEAFKLKNLIVICNNEAYEVKSVIPWNSHYEVMLWQVL